MQARHRNSGEGMRSYRSGYRGFGRGGFSRGHSKPYAPPPPPLPPRKADVFLEAGRLAAEYLVSKGLLPPNSLPARWQERSFQEPKDRETAAPPPPQSAFSRLGSLVPENHGRRRFDDEYNHAGMKRGRRRGPYNRSYSSDWGRENGRNGPWMERSGRHWDGPEGDDDFAPGYHRERRSGFDDVGTSVSRVSRDERRSRSESGSEIENHEVVDDTGSKASSSSTKKDQLTEVGVEMSKSKEQDDDAKVDNLDNGDVKSDASGDSEKKIQQGEEMDFHANTTEDDSAGKLNNDLLKLCSFAKVPTKPRSSLTQRNDKHDQVLFSTGSAAFGGTSDGEFKATADDKPMEGSSSNSHADQDENLEHEPHKVTDEPMEEAVDGDNEANDNPPGFETFDSAIVEEEDGSFEQHIDKSEGINGELDLTPSEIPQEDDYSSLHDNGDTQTKPYIESIPSDDEMVEEIKPEKSASPVLFSKGEHETDYKFEEDKQLEPASVKTFDLNLMDAPEMTEIPDGSAMSSLQASVSTIITEEEAPVGFGLSIGHNVNGSDVYTRVSGDDKMVPIINLEDDSPIEETACGSSKPKNEMIYSSLENFLSHTDHADDLHGMQDGYSLAISELLGSDIPGCPSVSSDLNNLQTGMGLHGPEGVPGVDDSIYVTLGELPIGFMEVWDQPPQEFGKFF
ncbi:hypothetical protein J5N97_019971 [Dioscorea zingiberensis]|uniref:Uncharacterized protein n=1 Tax=Dioscorea zingiberensis TaxID=325984 RepID=A0A9D5CG27_9LILI|nr:hypothetical protein J5N97_019971 [Dioscorea zingiberensis]